MNHSGTLWKRLGAFLTALPLMIFPLESVEAHGGHGGGGGHHSGGGSHHSGSHQSGQHHQGSHHQGEHHNGQHHNGEHHNGDHHNGNHHNEMNHHDYHHNEFNRDARRYGGVGGVGGDEAIVVPGGGYDNGDGYNNSIDPTLEEDALYNADVKQTRSQSQQTPNVNVNLEGGKSGN